MKLKIKLLKMTGDKDISSCLWSWRLGSLHEKYFPQTHALKRLVPSRRCYVCRGYGVFRKKYGPGQALVVHSLDLLPILFSLSLSLCVSVFLPLPLSPPSAFWVQCDGLHCCSPAFPAWCHTFLFMVTSFFPELWASLILPSLLIFCQGILSQQDKSN